MDRTRGVAIGGAALGLALLVWVSAAGSVSPLRAPTADLPRSRATPTPVATATPTPTGTASRASAPPTLGSTWELLAVVLTVAIVAAALLVLWALWRWWRERDRARVEPPPARRFEPVPDVQEALAGTASRQLDVLADGTPRNAIVACWLALEEAAGAAGLPRDPAETSAEFTARVIATYAVDRGAIATLSGLYREARFSAHPLGEDARSRARASLATLHADLSRRPDVVSARPGALP